MRDIRRVAMDLLARREHAKSELIEKLCAKGFSKADSQTLLEDLMQTELQSDTRFTEQYVYARKEKGFGPVRIGYELAERAIAEELIQQYLASHDWFVHANRVRAKRFGISKITNIKARAKQMQFLQYRGFNHEHIRSALDELEKISS